jgi:hypothetical protein
MIYRNVYFYKVVKSLREYLVGHGVADQFRFNDEYTDTSKIKVPEDYATEAEAEYNWSAIYKGFTHFTEKYTVGHFRFHTRDRLLFAKHQEALLDLLCTGHSSVLPERSWHWDDRVNPLPNGKSRYVPLYQFIVYLHESPRKDWGKAAPMAVCLSPDKRADASLFMHSAHDAGIDVHNWSVDTTSDSLICKVSRKRDAEALRAFVPDLQTFVQGVGEGSDRHFHLKIMFPI